jgi:hypothetical protein
LLDKAMGLRAVDAAQDLDEAFLADAVGLVARFGLT